jgi:hypothetical protein
MDVVNSDYYMPKEIQEGLQLPYINGTRIPDPVAALYSNQSLDKDDTMYDPYNLTTSNFFGNTEPIPEIKLLIPEGYRDTLSLDTTTQAKLCNKINGNSACREIYRAKIRGMITKIPGPYFYTSYRQISFLKGQLMTSIP